MKFVNLGEKPLKFDLCGEWFECEVAGAVEIPEKVAFCVKLHGIPLTPASEVEPAPAAAPVAEPEPVVEPEPMVSKSKKSK